MINNSLRNVNCDVFREEQSVGIPITTYPVTITYQNISMPSADKNWHTPSVIVYSSDDGKFTPLGEVSNNHYTQHSITRSDAYGMKAKAVDYLYESHHLPEWENWEKWLELNKKGTVCTVTAVRYGQYVLVRMENCGIVVSATTTLSDEYRSKSLYLSITGELCIMTDFVVKRESYEIEEGMIAPVKFNRTDAFELVGDIPNIDCSGWWIAHSDGIVIGSSPVHIKYNTISYQGASEKWHTPLVVVFSSLDQNVNGIAYSELSVTRSDGYGWNAGAEHYSFETEFSDDWTDWDSWLAANKSGVIDCEITAVRTADNTIMLTQTNSGVTVKSVIQIPIINDLPVCLSLSGELCAISNIRVQRDE